MDFGLSDRVVIITGGSRGIGRAAARLFAKEGARVALTYRSDQAAADAVVDEIGSAGGEAMALRWDLASPQSARGVAAAVAERWQRIDVLVNNAVHWGKRRPWEAPQFEALPEDEVHDVLRANIEGAYAMTQAVLPSMRERGWGRIVNVSSGVAVDGVPGTAPYAAAKAALHGLTRTLAKELGPAGVLVNVVMPGLTLTERNAAELPKAAKEQMERASPIRRLLPPEEVVPQIAFLCSAMNTAVTGEIIRASGGIS